MENLPNNEDIDLLLKLYKHIIITLKFGVKITPKLLPLFKKTEIVAASL